MGENKKKIILTLLMFMCIAFIYTNSYAHSGRTDSNGGHKDNKNVSGLGSYHYHCGGNPAHLHTNGVCPYSSGSSSSSSKSSTTSSSSSNGSSISKSTSTSTKTIDTTPSVVVASNVQINEKLEDIKVGESRKLTVTILPDNTTDKSISWKSSDESVIVINALGEITVKKVGTVEITASTSNDKMDTIKITVKEDEKMGNNDIIKVSTDNSNTVSNTTNNNSEDSNPIGKLLTLGLLGGGGYLGYKKYKRNKNN